MAKKTKTKTVKTIKHDGDKRKNIPTAEFQSVLKTEDQKPVELKYPRNTDLDPQLVWRGKDEQDWSDLVVSAPPIYIQEKVHPKVLIDDLLARTRETKSQTPNFQPDLFADFNGIEEGADKTEFYQHDQNWSNRMILGDSLQVMASLAEREGLRGKVQCIYLDPPYGIKFNSNFQWSTTSNKVTDGKTGHITREPEQVKAFRDTWRDGIHSYLTYLRDRFTVARDLLSDSGSIFVQIGDENVHRVRAMMDEVFGETNFCSLISFETTTGQTSLYLAQNNDFLLWYSKDSTKTKFRSLTRPKLAGQEGGTGYKYIWTADLMEKSFEGVCESGEKVFMKGDATSQRQGRPSGEGSAMHFSVQCQGKYFVPRGGRGWSTTETGMERLMKADRLLTNGINLAYRRFLEDSPVLPIVATWRDTGSGFMSDKIYVVQTNTKVIERCLLMATDPGDLVLDPTCGSGTTAFVAEKWARRWITIDTSRVALALARARIMGARYPYYLLSDSRKGQIKEAKVTRTAPSSQPVSGNIHHGFVYERVPHITLKAIANNTEIDVIWDKWQDTLEPLREKLNTALKEKWEEWEIPREADDGWTKTAKKLHADWWEARIARQSEIDASIAAKAEFEYLYDKPYDDKKIARVAGPFTVESLSPHRTLGVDEYDDLIDPAVPEHRQSFPQMILENLKVAGVQQAHKEDRIVFTSLMAWPGDFICAEGRFEASEEWLAAGDLSQGTSHKSPTTEKRAAIFIGPEFGTVQRPDLVAAALEAGESGFDVLVACAFNYEARTTEFAKLGRLPVLKARMNADLHMDKDLKKTDKGNLFVIFGEPDVEVVCGEWLVTREGREVANYDGVKELSGLGSLEEINRVGGADLPGFKELSSGRAFWSDQPGEAGGGISPVEHRGGGGAEGDGGVSSISEHSQRVAGGGGDPIDDREPSGDASGGKSRSAAGPVGGNQQNAWRTQALAGIETLKASDFPLSLTTSHYAQVTVHGVDIFKPQTGEVVSDNADGIACWFIDTDYNEESFFVRHAYFLGANDPYKSLKTTLKAEIDREAWETLHSDVSRPFARPKSGRIAVKVINHLGDEVMKVFKA